MFLSLIKILLFIAIVMGLTFGATMLMDVSGGATIVIAGIELSLSLLQLVFAFLILVVLVILGLILSKLLIAVFYFLNGDETAISRYFDRNRERKGYEALSEGMMALASGEGHLALTKSYRAEKLLKQPRLTNLLTAQAAELIGDKQMAEATYKKLLEDDKTRFVGVRGLMKQKLQSGDTVMGLKLAQKAFSLKPRHEETQDVLLKLQAKAEDWKGARKTLGIKLKLGSLPRDVHKRRDAVLALSEARDNLSDGNDVEAYERAIEANRLSPDLIQAAVMAARGYIAQGNARYAARILAKTWATKPHPDLAVVFAEIVSGENPLIRLKRFYALTKQAPTHPETKMLLAELNISAGDFPAAKRALGDLIEVDPTSRCLTLMAAIERGQGGDDVVVRGWLTRALTSPRGPQWICDSCQHIHMAWGPTCSNCESFDTLSWTRPLTSDVAMPAGTEMLPLIVGQVVDQSMTNTDIVEAEIVDTSLKK